MTKLDGLVRSIAYEFPDFRICKKSDSVLMGICDALLRVLSFGRVTGFLNEYVTILGYTMYVPNCWNEIPEARRMLVLRHERVHMRQRHRYGLLPFLFLYLFVPLPFLFAYFRMKFEREAYAETVRATYELLEDGPTRVHSPEFRRNIIENFTGPAYLWAWPWRTSLERWYDELLSELGPRINKLA